MSDQLSLKFLFDFDQEIFVLADVHLKNTGINLEIGYSSLS